MISVQYLSELFNKKPVYAVWHISDAHPTGELIMSFDSIQRVDFKASSTLTNYPIEQGTAVTDYKYNNPDTLSLTGIVSRTGLYHGVGLGVVDSDTAIDKIRQSLDTYLKGIYRLKIQTKNGVYDWFTLQSYDISENYENYGLFEVDMSFQQIMRPPSVQNPAQAAYADTLSVGVVLKKLFSE